LALLHLQVHRGRRYFLLKEGGQGSTGGFSHFDQVQDLLLSSIFFADNVPLADSSEIDAGVVGVS